MAHANEFGVIGLGRMGSNLAHQAMDKGFRVIGDDRTAAPKEFVAWISSNDGRCRSRLGRS